jgi:hypothetical protein
MRADRVQPRRQTSQSVPKDAHGHSAGSRLLLLAALVVALGLLAAPMAAAGSLGPDPEDLMGEDTTPSIRTPFTERPVTPASLLFFTENNLEDDEQSRWNFTAAPPQSTDRKDTKRAGTMTADPTVAQWTWFLPAAPVSWFVHPGDPWEFILHIEGLTQEEDNDTQGPTYMIDVEASTSLGTHANGTTKTEPMRFPAQVQRHNVTAFVGETHQFRPGHDDPHMKITITLTSLDGELPGSLYLHYGTLDQSSRLILPRYPANALEDAQATQPTDATKQILCLVEAVLEDTCAQKEEAEEQGPQGEDNGEQPDEPGSPSSSEGPQDPSRSTTGTTATTGTSSKGNLAPPAEKTPTSGEQKEDDEKNDLVNPASTSGILVVLAWTLFVASTGSLGRSKRLAETKQDREASPSRPSASNMRTRRRGDGSA